MGVVSLAGLAVVLLSTASAMPNGTGNTVMFAPYLLVPTATVPETFLSFNFDWNLNVSHGDAWTNASFGWTLDLQDKRLRALAKALSPANLRIGGSDADSAVYNEEFPGGIECPEEVIAKHQCLSPSRWDQTIAFADEVDLRIVFTLNMMVSTRVFKLPSGLIVPTHPLVFCHDLFLTTVSAAATHIKKKNPHNVTD